MKCLVPLYKLLIVYNRCVCELVPRELVGAYVTQGKQGAIHGNPVSGNHPCAQPYQGSVTLINQWETAYLTSY